MTITDDNRINHQDLLKLADNRPPLKCEEGKSNPPAPTSCLSPIVGNNTLSEAEARKLLNYLIVYTMMDSRYMVPDSVIREIKEEKALLHLIQKNWMGLDSIHALVKNVIQQKKPEYGGYVGDFQMTNQEFIINLRQRLLDSTLVDLGIFKVSDQELLNEIMFIQQQIQLSGIHFGTPKDNIKKKSNRIF
jgi:hypothetical protein